MKVFLVNGSPHEFGCTHRALQEISDTLNKLNVETEIFWIGNQPIGGCIGCKSCVKIGKCVFDDVVNRFRDLAGDADGFIFGTPVHFAGASGAMTCFMDRLFYSDPDRRHFRLKPAAAITSARRGGTTAAFDQMIKYFTVSEMTVVSSCYWNMVHGNTPAEVEQDAEGMHIMQKLAENMAYVLRCQEAGRAAGIPMPERGPAVKTNFIR